MIWIVIAGLMELAWVLAVVNRILGLRLQIREAWSGVLVQLQRRSDLLSDLVPVVTAARDQETLHTALAELRSTLSEGVSVERVDRAAQALGIATARLLEHFPTLQSDENFGHLRVTLIDLENELQGARMLFNQAVSRYNERCLTAPGLLVARSLRQRPAAYFEAADIRSV